MNRQQLAHALRAACQIVSDPDILVVGSQSLLASFDENELPPAASASMELDLAFFDDPTDEKADAVDGAIGELYAFHESFGFYVQGVSVSTGVLPEGCANESCAGPTVPPARRTRRSSSRTTASSPSSSPTAKRI